MWGIKSKVCHKICISQSQDATKNNEVWLAGSENLAMIFRGKTKKYLVITSLYMYGSSQD